MNNKIINYMKRTAPETALKANTADGIRTIRREVKEEIAYLLRCKETAELLGFKETAKEAFDEAVFACKWLIKFGLTD